MKLHISYDMKIKLMKYLIGVASLYQLTNTKLWDALSILHHEMTSKRKMTINES